MIEKNIYNFFFQIEVLCYPFVLKCWAPKVEKHILRSSKAAKSLANPSTLDQAVL